MMHIKPLERITLLAVSVLAAGVTVTCIPDVGHSPLMPNSPYNQAAGGNVSTGAEPQWRNRRGARSS